MPNRRILRGEIKFISLCKRGANRLPVIYKEDGAFDCEMLMKAADDFMEKGELLAVVYAPEFRDSQGDIASATVVKDMMYAAAKNGESIDIRHDGKALDKNQVYVAERFLVQKGDARFADFKDYEGKTVDVTGAWATVLKIEDQKLRDHYKAGDWNGVSMGGTADLATEKTDDSIVQKVVDAFAKSLGLNEEDDDMKPEELAAALEKNNEALVSGIGDAVAKAIKGEPASKSGDKDDKDDKDDKEAKAPVFKGDYSKPEDVAKHQEALASWNLRKDIDWEDAESVQKYQDELKKLADAKKAEGDDGDSEEVKKLKLEKKEAEDRLNVAMGKSQQGTIDGPAPGAKPDDNKAMVTGMDMSKEDMDLFTLGRTMGKAVNETSGIK